MRLELIRHGESEFNASGRIQGQLNTPLSMLGQRQALALASAYRGEAIDAVIASPLDRAQQTAAPIAAALARPIRSDDRLMELNAGIFQGLVWDEIALRFADAATRWKSHDPDYAIPEGESRRDLMRRAEAVLHDIRGWGLERVVIVAHGGWMAAALKVLLKIDPNQNPFSF